MQALVKEHVVKSLLDCDEQDLKDHFHEFVDLSVRITDWEMEGEAVEGGANDDMGVAVDFDDDDDHDAQHGAHPHACISACRRLRFCHVYESCSTTQPAQQLACCCGAYV